MDVAKYKKNLEQRLEVDKLRREVNKELQIHDDQQQNLQLEREELFQPITSNLKEVKKTIDDRQDQLLEKLTENQLALTTAVQQQSLPSPDQVKDFIADPNQGFTQDEMQRLKEKYKLNPPSNVLLQLRKGLNWEDLNMSIGSKLQSLGGKKGSLSKGKKKKNNSAEIIALTEDIELIQRYQKRIDLLNRGQTLLPQSGEGIRKYKQSPRNAYKIDKSGQYGTLMINVPRLMNEMVVEAAKGGSIIYEQKADKSLINLLTKRYNPHSTYSDRAIQIFQDLSTLANLPVHKSSGKSKLLHSPPQSGGQIYFTSPQELIKRLTLLTGSRLAGNTNIQMRNEIWEILDYLLKHNEISRLKYDAYIQKYLQ